MARTTIDFGIDLGTTNSAIAQLKGTEVEVFRNNENDEFTPSVVWMDKNNRQIVGRSAKQMLEADPDDAFSEFKLQMGTTQEYRFARSGRVMKPEELSAEVLKSLKSDVRQRTGEDVQAAVITVPAAFELPACDATKRAAQLAGLTISPLLQEPVAAALAYGFQSESDRVFWLVYDLGGGTFDAAVMQVRDGVIQVVNHGGDNHLGGKLIDWEIVDQLFIPALTQQYKLRDLQRGNPKWRAAIAKLKLKAEEGKIRVSRVESADIIIDYLCQDERGEPVRFEYELKRKDVERLSEPFIVRSINICKRVLADKRLGVGDIEKVLLVGGPTLTPYLRQRLADPTQGLGIALEFSVDPLTVVARGAAIFAGTQRLQQAPEVLASRRQEGTFTISFPKWVFKGSETEPLVAGVVQAPAGQSLAGHTVEFINADARPQWRSGRIGLAPNGGFMTSLWAEKGRPNTVSVELCDSTGRPCQVATDPETLTYTVGLVITNSPLTHNVGVALVGNEVAWFMEKGTPLPARKRSVLHTAFEVRQGHAGDLVRIPIIEGMNSRADRNRRIGNLEVHAQEVRRDIPLGADVEVTLEIDESRLTRATAYIPILDEEFDEITYLTGGAAPRPEELSQQAEGEKKRLTEARKQVEETADLQAQQALGRIDSENMVHDVDAALAAASADPDAAAKCASRVLDLRLAIDEVEAALEWPALVAEAEKLIGTANELIGSHGNADDRRNLQQREAEIRAVMQSHDPDVLRQRVSELRILALHVLDRVGVLPVWRFQRMCDLKEQMRDRTRADQLMAQGLRAMNANDTEGLRAINRQLAELLPVSMADIDSTMTR